LAMGLNEFAGYLAVAAATFATGWVAARSGLRPVPFYLGVIFVAAGFALSLLVRDTTAHARLESTLKRAGGSSDLIPRDVFWQMTVRDRNLSSATQVGLVNNLNDGMAWGLFPILFAAAGMSLTEIGVLAGLYPAVWGMTQIVAGALSDRLGRKWLIVAGMWIQAAGIYAVSASAGFAGFAAGGALLGVGTAMVYPTLLAAIGDVAGPSWRALAIGWYRLWRDLGYAIGALVAGVSAELFGVPGAMKIVAGITFASGVVAAVRMSETRVLTRTR
jgi:predicted MFS family arabinose efflux permease